MHNFFKTKAFSLIELMVAVAVLAIITAVAVPTYQSHVLKARRADAKATLMGEAQALERCFTDVNTFAGCRDYGEDGLLSPHEYYTITGNINSTTYTLTATATQAGTLLCHTFTLNHLGSRTAQDSGGNDTSDRCWN